MKSKISFDSIKVGDTLPECPVKISQPMINEYAEISRDFNPIHVDLEAAAKSEFKGTIAHGCIPVEPVIQGISTWLGIPWFAQGTKMNLRYRALSRPGDTIKSQAKVIEKKKVEGKNVAVIEFSCLNQRGEPVITGQWDVVVP